MTAIETHKENLIRKIQIIDNQVVLDSIDNLLNSIGTTELIYRTSDSQKKSILQGIDDIKNGFFYSQEQIDNFDLQWLNEK